MTQKTSFPGAADDMLRRDFVTPEFKRAVKPVIGAERFNAAPRPRR